MGLDETITAYRQACADVVNGDATALKGLYSEGDDVSLANPWGPARCGRAGVFEAVGRAATQFRDGGPRAEPHDTVALFLGTDLACLVENERWQAKVAGGDEVSAFDLRATTVFRQEDSGWKVVHRHADPITTPNPRGPLRPG
jgi:ketosteroid isomerase-like protein